MENFILSHPAISGMSLSAQHSYTGEYTEHFIDSSFIGYNVIILMISINSHATTKPWICQSRKSSE